MKDAVITGVGVISPYGAGKEKLWEGLEKGTNAISEISSFYTDKFKIHLAGEVKDFEPKEILGIKGLRNLNRTTLLLLVAAHQAIEDSGIEINADNTDVFGVSTATSYAHPASCIGAMHRGIIPPTINLKKKDPRCQIDCVPNKGQRKKVNLCLVIAFGPGGYNSASVLEKYNN